MRRNLTVSAVIFDDVGILVVKLFGWELAMKKRIEDVREEELKRIRQWNWSIAAIMTVVTCLSAVLSASTFTVYTLLGMYVPLY